MPKTAQTPQKNPPLSNSLQMALRPRMRRTKKHGEHNLQNFSVYGIGCKRYLEYYIWYVIVSN